MEIEKILEERSKTHGDYSKVASLDTKLFSTFHTHCYSVLSDKQYCSIKQILHKIARIGAGDASFIDHWKDIVGYATLVIKDLEEQQIKDL